MIELYTLVINGMALESKMTERDIFILTEELYPNFTAEISSERKIVFLERKQHD